MQHLRLRLREEAGKGMGLGAVDSGDGDAAKWEKRSLGMAGPTWRVVAMKLSLAKLGSAETPAFVVVLWVYT